MFAILACRCIIFAFTAGTREEHKRYEAEHSTDGVTSGRVPEPAGARAVPVRC
jgi:hypothetical protein